MKPLDPRLIKRSAAVRRYLIISAALGTAAAFLIIGQAWFIAVVVSRGFESETVDALITIFVALGLVFVSRSLVMWAHQVASARAASRLKHQLRLEIAEAVLDPHRIGARPDSGFVTTVLGAGLDSLDNYFARYLPQLILAVTVPASVVVSMAWADWIAAITVALTLPLIPVFMILVGWLTQERTERRWQALVRLGRHFADVIDGIVVLKLFGRDQSETLKKIGEEHRVQTMGALRLAFLSGFVLDLLSTISVALVAVGVGLRIVDGDLALGIGLFVLLLAPEAFLPVRQVGTHFHASAEGIAAANDAFEILDYQHITNATAEAKTEQVIEFSDVVVSYPDRTQAALGPVSFTIEPGAVTALIGPSGSGKSTALAVLLGLAQVEQGNVRIGDVDLAEIDFVSWRKQVAWVPQRPGLISGTIAENVSFGSDQITEADVRRALNEAGAGHFELAQTVQDLGANFSAGERRRIGIARALAHLRAQQGWLLLLDEPTAGLDAENERHIIDAIADLHATVVMISHRDVSFADHVVNLGQVVS